MTSRSSWEYLDRTGILPAATAGPGARIAVGDRPLDLVPAEGPSIEVTRRQRGEPAPDRVVAPPHPVETIVESA